MSTISLSISLSLSLSLYIYTYIHSILVYHMYIQYCGHILRVLSAEELRDYTEYLQIKLHGPSDRPQHFVESTQPLAPRRFVPISVRLSGSIFRTHLCPLCGRRHAYGATRLHENFPRGTHGRFCPSLVDGDVLIWGNLSQIDLSFQMGEAVSILSYVSAFGSSASFGIEFHL